MTPTDADFFEPVDCELGFPNRSPRLIINDGPSHRPADARSVERVIWSRSVLRLPARIVRAGYPPWQHVSLWWALTVGMFVALYLLHW